MPEKLWAETTSTAVYLMNRIYSYAINEIPYQVYYNKKIDLSNLREFGCKVFVHVKPNKRHNKLSERAIEKVLIGYGDTTRSYRVIDKQYRQVELTSNVHFVDDKDKKLISIYVPNTKQDEDDETSKLSDNEDKCTDEQIDLDESIDLVNVDPKIEDSDDNKIKIHENVNQNEIDSRNNEMFNDGKIIEQIFEFKIQKTDVVVKNDAFVQWIKSI